MCVVYSQGIYVFLHSVAQAKLFPNLLSGNGLWLRFIMYYVNVADKRNLCMLY